MNKDTMLIHYDDEEDILCFHSKDNYEYEVSDFLTNLIVLDYNKDRLPIGIDILHASEVLNTKKDFIKNIKKGEITIEISEEEIELRLNLTISFDKKATTLPINFIVANKYQIPSIQTEIAVASV